MKDFAYSKEELLMIENFSKSFNITNSLEVIEFGKIVQDKLSILSNKLLEESRNKDTNSITSLISEIVNELNKLDRKEEKKGFFSFFRKEVREEPSEVKYETILNNIELLKSELQKHIITLNKDLQFLELLSANNDEYLRELNMYLIAGKLILERVKKEAELSKNDPLLYNDYMQAIDRFEKKLYDLELTKTMTFQMLPQINLMKDNTFVLIDKINSLIKNTIPLCKSQLVILLSYKNQEKVMKEQSEISRLLNEALTENAVGLGEMSKGLKNELENGLISQRTLKETTNRLLKELEEITKSEEPKKSDEESSEKTLEINESEIFVLKL